MTTSLGLVPRKGTRNPQRCHSEGFVLVLVLTECHICLPIGIIAYVEIDCKIHRTKTKRASISYKYQIQYIIHLMNQMPFAVRTVGVGRKRFMM